MLVSCHNNNDGNNLKSILINFNSSLVGDRTISDRGCVVRGTNDATTCTAANQGVAPRDCNLCTDSECNSSASIVASIALICASVLVAMRLH